MTEQRWSSAEDRRPAGTPADAAGDLDERTDDRGAAARPGLTRRRLIQGLAAGGAVAGSGGLRTVPNARAQEGSATPAGEQIPITPPALRVAGDVDVTLRLAPETFPTEEEQAADPRRRADAETLRLWMDANPGVRFEDITLDTSTGEQQALVTAIAGGSAPSWYGGWVLGGTVGELSTAFKQGLIADITPLVEQSGVTERLSETARNLWRPWVADGQIYSLPWDYVFAGSGIYFRRDLIAEAGLEEPKPGWTWDDLRALAKGLTTERRKGIGLPNWAMGLALNAEAADLMTQIPAPQEDWHWRYDYQSRIDTWVETIATLRGMIFDDQSVFSDITLSWVGSDGMVQDTQAMVLLHSGEMNLPRPGATGLASMEEVFDTPIDDLLGFVALPVGKTGFFGASQPSVSLKLFDPNLDEDALAKVVDLHVFLNIADGWTYKRELTWNLTGDPVQVYDQYSPVNGITQIPGVPASAEDVWPKRFLASVREMEQIPIVPTEGEFIPAEESAGPTGTAWTDAQSRWMYEPGDLDLAADLEELESLRNAEAAGFESSVADDAFVAGARAYYEAHSRFWQEHAPEFHSAVFQPWYEAQILPALG